MIGETNSNKFCLLKRIFIVFFILLIGIVIYFGYVGNKQQKEEEEKNKHLGYLYISGLVHKSLMNGDYFETIKLAEIHQEQYPDDVYGYLAKASAYLQLGSLTLRKGMDCNLAISEIEKALEIDKEFSESYRLLAYAFLMKGDFETAESLYTKAIELSPINANAYVGRGELYNILGDQQKYFFDIQKALEVNPDSPEAFIALANYYISYNKTDTVDVVEILSTAINLSEEEVLIAEAYKILGGYYLKNGQYKGAEELYLLAIENEELLADAYIGLAVTEKYLLENIRGEEERQEKINYIKELLQKATDINPEFTVENWDINNIFMLTTSVKDFCRPDRNSFYCFEKEKDFDQIFDICSNIPDAQLYPPVDLEKRNTGTKIEIKGDTPTWILEKGGDEEYFISKNKDLLKEYSYKMNQIFNCEEIDICRNISGIQIDVPHNYFKIGGRLCQSLEDVNSFKEKVFSEGNNFYYDQTYNLNMNSFELSEFEEINTNINNATSSDSNKRADPIISIKIKGSVLSNENCVIEWRAENVENCSLIEVGTDFKESVELKGEKEIFSGSYKVECLSLDTALKVESKSIKCLSNIDFFEI
jgi:tetratricopeptide (TPR) repeat protein